MYIHVCSLHRFRSALGKVIVKSGSRERVSRSKWIMKRNRLKIETVISLHEEGRGRRGERRNIFQREIVLNVSIRFVIVVGHCRFI